MRKINFHKCFISFSIICILPCAAFSQKWINYSIANGMSSNFISSIVEDDHQKIWIGTSEGLNQFNGRDWTIYSRAKGDSLINDIIMEIMKDSEGSLWIGTWSGIIKIDPDDDLENPASWHNYNQNNTKCKLLVDPITAILEDDSGKVWFGTWEKGICIVNPEPSESQDPLLNPDNWTIVNSDSQLLSLEIFAIEKDNLGNIWIGTFEGVSRYNPKEHDIDGKWDLIPELDDVRCIFADSHGYIWFGRAGAGVARVKPENPHNIEEFSFAIDADVIGEDSDGKIWFGTADSGDGIYVVDLKSNLKDFNNWFEYTQNDGLASNVISCIFRDTDGDMWIGTGEMGISKYDISWINFSQTKLNLNFKNVVTIAEDDSQNIWLGTDDSGIRIVNLNNNLLVEENWSKIYKREKALSSNIINSIYKDDTGNFWIGTQAEDLSDDPIYAGLDLVNPFSNLSDPTNWIAFKVQNTDSGLADNSVNVIIQDQLRYMWFGTINGLSRVHRNSITEISSWTKFDTADGLNSNVINSLLEDNQNYLWVGTANGLNRKDLKNDIKIRWETIEIFDGKIINTIFEDLKKNLWIGTNGNGLYKTNLSLPLPNPSNWHRITSTVGLYTNTTVNSILQSDSSQYWFATGSGLIRLRISGNDSLWTLFQAEDGPESINILKTFEDSNKDIWFGTVGKGVTRHRIKKNAPETFMTSKLDVITSENTVLTFKGVDLSTTPQMLEYSYKFDDNEWSQFQSSEVIPIFGLKTGKHIFNVRASDMDGNIDPTPATNIFYKVDPELGGKVQLCDSIACVRIYLPPATLIAGREAATMTHKKNYELKDSSFVIVAYNIMIRKTTEASDKPVTLAISLLSNQNLNKSELAIFQQNEKFGWSGIGGTISHINDTLTITTSITGSGIYAVRKKSPDPDTLQTCKMNVQPRIFSPTGNGQGHGNCANISFSLQQNSVTTIKVYNIAGRLKRIIKDNEPLLLGINVVEWDGKDDDGNYCPTGLYIVTVETNEKVYTKTVMVSNKYF